LNHTCKKLLCHDIKMKDKCQAEKIE